MIEKNIMFDLYGTLIDIHTDEESVRFWNRLIKKIKPSVPYTAAELKKKYLIKCKDLEKEKEEINILDVFMDIFDVDKEKARTIAIEFRRLSTKYIRLYKGVRKLLKKISREGYQLFILSNAQESFTLPELKKLKIDSYFNGIAISSDYGVKKPNREFYKRAMQNFKIETAVMIGNDVECDILPAQAIGLKTIFIESNLTPKHDYEEKIKGFKNSVLYEKIIELTI